MTCTHCLRLGAQGHTGCGSPPSDCSCWCVSQRIAREERERKRAAEKAEERSRG